MKIQKLTAGLLALSMMGTSALASVPALTVCAAETTTSGTCGEHLTWTFDTISGTLTISGEGEMADDLSKDELWVSLREKVVSVVIEDGVTNIGKWAFMMCNALNAVTIPDSVTSIGNNAFANCKKLNTIKIPEGVTSIGESAFSSCYALSSVTIPESVTSIGTGAFSYTLWLAEMQKSSPLVIVNGILIDGKNCTGDVIIPDGVTSITGMAFYECQTLTSITIPDGVQSIGDMAFLSCEALADVTVPDSVTSVGKLAFFRTPWLEAKQKENPLVIAGSVVIDGKTCAGDVTIPDGVTSIGELAFEGCTALTSVTIPYTVTNIGANAFAGCETLTISGYDDSAAQAYATENGFTFDSLGEAPVPDILTGDVDGSEAIDIIDVILINKYLLGSTSLTDLQKAAADVDKNGEIDPTDSLNILKYVVELITEFEAS